MLVKSLLRPVSRLVPYSSLRPFHTSPILSLDLSLPPHELEEAANKAAQPQPTAPVKLRQTFRKVKYAADPDNLPRPLSLTDGVKIRKHLLGVNHKGAADVAQVKRQLKKAKKNMSAPPFNDLTYYTFGTPNGLKPAILLEELDLKYKCEKIDISKNTQKEDWFLAINPNGRIPALKDGDMRVFESGAIMIYLVDHYDEKKKFTYRRDTPEHYEMLSWLMFQMGGIGPMQGQANHFRAMAGARSDYGIKRYMDETKRLFSVLEIRLSQADWLAGDKYTIADMANYSWVRAGPVVLSGGVDGVDSLAAWPGVERWCARIEERPAVQRALNVPPSSRTPEETKEMFATMRAKINAMENSDKH